MSYDLALELTAKLKDVLIRERANTVEIIELLVEVERERLYLALGYSSLWNYVHRALGQSTTMTQYRVAAARAVRRFPQVLEMLRDGRLCMTTVNQLAGVITEQNCHDVLAEADGKTKREVDQIVARIKPEPEPVRDVTVPALVVEPVQTKVLTESLARKHITVDRQYEELLVAARAALSHKMPGAAELDILKEGLRQVIKNAEKRKGIVEKPRADRKATDGDIPQSVRRAVWKRDAGKCQWRTADGEICGSTHQVEFHHRQDRSKGGLGSVANVMLLCKVHNQFAAELSCGEEYIQARRSRRRSEASPAEPAPEERQPQLAFT